MKKDPWDKYYNKAKELRINAIYADTLCELIRKNCLLEFHRMIFLSSKEQEY